MYYNTNLEDYREIDMYLPIQKDDVISLIKTDISGFSFPVMFLVKNVEVDKQYAELEALMPKYGKVM